MKRPWLVSLLTITHALFAVACAVGLWVILHETLKAEIVVKGGDTVRGLYMGAWGVGAGALLYGLMATGLWFGRKWGWWLGIVFDGALGGAILLDPLTERNWDWEDTWLGFVLVTLVVLMVSPPVRKFFFKRGSALVPTTKAAEGTA